MRRAVITLRDEAFEGGRVRVGQVMALPPGEAHHLRDVLRMKVGDRLLVADGRGRHWPADVWQITPYGVNVKLTGRYERTPAPAPVTVAVGLVKKGFDEIVRKAVEVGIAAVIPLRTAFTTKNIQPRHDRWRRIAEQAEKQSGRAHSLQIGPAVPLAEYVGSRSPPGLFVADVEAAAPISLAAGAVDPPYEIVIGPEGGWSAEERELLHRAGFAPVSLGEAILRTETAAIAAGVLLGEVARVRGYGGP